MGILKEKIIREFKAIKDSDLNCLLILFSLLVVLGGIVCIREYIKTDDSYNELMVAEIEKSKIQEEHNKLVEQGNVVSMNFDYSFGESEYFKIESVYDDGATIYICFKSKSFSIPPFATIPIIPSIYIKEIDKNEFVPVNYRIFNNTQKLKTIYLIDKLAKEIELRYSDSETIKIERKN